MDFLSCLFTAQHATYADCLIYIFRHVPPTSLRALFQRSAVADAPHLCQALLFFAPLILPLARLIPRHRTIFAVSLSHDAHYYKLTIAYCFLITVLIYARY